MSQIQEQPNELPQPLQLSYVSLAGEDVLSATRDNVHLLQHAADFEVCTRNLRRSGIGDIIWGLLCCLLAGPSIRYDSLNVGVLLLGLVLVGVGFWILVRPSPIGMIVDGLTLLLVATWNIFINVLLATSAAGRLIGYGPVLALAQIGWGVHRLRTYSRYKLAAEMRPSPTTLQWLGQLIKSTLKANAKKDPSVVQFVRRGAFVYERWKGRLLPEIAIFVMVTGSFGGRRDAVLASRDEVEFLSQKKRFLRKQYSIKLRLGSKEFKVVMSLASRNKLMEWLASIPQVGTPSGAPTLPVAVKPS